MRRAYDAIVIGAGVMGASFAFHLARRGPGGSPSSNDAPSARATPASPAQSYRMHYTNEQETRLALASQPYFQHWSEIRRGTSGFTQDGFPAIGRAGQRRAAAPQRRAASALGVKTRAIGPEELRQVQRR
jgi:glycine/D-amino acid oxidase-like deaminating enzyme